MLEEINLIKSIKKSFPSHIGDDAAFLCLKDSNSYQVITKDLLVEDVHFRTSYYTPKQLAQKSLAVNLSDVAAMGAKPEYILLGLSIPTHYEKYVKSFIKNIALHCKQQNIIIIGGDITLSPQSLFISITALGKAQKKNLKLRSGAEAGNIICTIGYPGYSHIGLYALENGLSGFHTFKQHCQQPKAYVQEGQWLGSQSAISSMMDLSDGIGTDLKKLCLQSNVGAKLILDNLPSNAKLKIACKKLNLDWQEVVINGGEDYGLLFTVQEKSFDLVNTKFQEEFNYPIQKIGTVCKTKKITVLKDNQLSPLQIKGFSHFKENSSLFSACS